jgi:DNA repair protein RadC
MADWPVGDWAIRSPRDVADRLLVEMGRLEREELRVLSLNAKNVVQRVSHVYMGNVSASLVRVGELFRDAVRLDASGVVLVHNHPSGDPTPSPDDLHLTAEAIAAGRLLDVDVLDHVIIGHDAWVSLRDRGVTFDRPGAVRAAAER